MITNFIEYNEHKQCDIVWHVGMIINWICFKKYDFDALLVTVGMVGIYACFC